MLLSILIPTLSSRADLLTRLMTSLESQAHSQEVEVIVESDNGELAIGSKRNILLDRSAGKFVSFIDDDDQVSDTYVKDILEAIKSDEDLDCVGFFGEVYFQDRFEGKMIHSIFCSDWTEETGWYYRPPNHLNPIRREHARRFRFRNISFSEDHFWSMDLHGSGKLKREVFLGHKPLYIYKCKDPKRGL